MDVNFYLSLEMFEKKSADKIWSNKDKGIKMSSPVPNRVKGWASTSFALQEPTFNACVFGAS